MRVRLALLAVLIAGGCASVAPHTHDEYDSRPLLAAQADALREAKAQIGALRGELSTLRAGLTAQDARLDSVEQRTGLRPFAPQQLTALDDQTTRFKASVEATVLDERDARPAKRQLGRHLAGYEGAVIAFWATWCVPCIADEELAAVRQLREELKGQGVALVSMAVDELDAVQRHRKASRWVYPLWHRKNGHLEMLPRAFVEQAGVKLPLFVVLSRSGQIRWFHNQALDDEEIREIVSAAVREGRL